MDHINIITKRATERKRNADGQVQPPPLLDSPLPTPRRSCATVDASLPRCRRDASPLRTHVPFSWESSPGVPKNRDMHKKAQAAMPPPPRPPPGRPQPWPPRNSYYYGNTSEASSDDDDDRSFSDALDRISSPERTGSFDRVTSKRFEDIFVGRATSFAKDRSSRHASADATDLSASGRHPRLQPHRSSTRRSSHDEDRRWTPRLLNDNVPMQLMQRIRMDAEAEEMTPRACGLMVFFPWSAKPAVCGFRGGNPAAQHATPRPGADVPSPRSHSRRITTTTTTTLRDVIKEDNEAVSGDLPQPRGEKKRGREDLQGRRLWGVSSLLDTSKKYCTDARKALSKLSIGLGADSGSPRVSREGRSGKLHDGFSSTPAAPAKLTQLKANRN
ncbi:hypothetical protein BAE44_0000931 [Dichanthelium oligosanthes]|uniref:Uncharacterized protein n=1 Tax=Dichanthelium oligosanthes TaxID=888268 RepID=A0A1E5WLN7_9POAL|nr:hypothetical protein BAE44_0000931 [Dichanthelium oligosanthes]